MAKKIIDLTNYVAPTTDNPDGRLKNQVYAGSVVTEVGSRLLADYDQDVLNVFLWLLRQAGSTPDGVADTQTTSQYIDALIDKIEGISGRDAVQQALSNFREMDINYLSPDSWLVGNGAMAYGNGVWVIAQYLSVAMKAYVIDGADNSDNSIHTAGVNGNKASEVFFTGVNFIFFENAFYSDPIMYCYTSTDGKTWTQVTIDNVVVDQEDEVRTAGKAGSTVVAVGYSITIPEPGKIYTSVNNGATWSEHSVTGLPDYPTCSAYSDEIMVVGGTDGASYSTDGITWAAIADVSGQDIRKAVYNGKRFILFNDTNAVFVSDADDSLDFTPATLPYSASNVDSAFVSNGVTVVHDPVNSILLSATRQGVIDNEWKAHASPFYTTTGAPITDNRLIGGNDEQILIAGHDTNPEKIAITPPIQR